METMASPQRVPNPPFGRSGPPPPGHGQPALHPADHGARDGVHGGAGVGRRRHGCARPCGGRHRGNPADHGRLAGHLAGTSVAGADPRRLDHGAEGAAGRDRGVLLFRTPLRAQLRSAAARGGPADRRAGADGPARRVARHLAPALRHRRRDGWRILGAGRSPHGTLFHGPRRRGAVGPAGLGKPRSWRRASAYSTSCSA